MGRGDVGVLMVARSVEEAYDDTARAALPSVVAVVAGFELLQAGVNLAVLDGPHALTLTVINAGAAVLLLCLWAVVRWRPVSGSLAQPLMALAFLTVVATAAVQLVLAEQPRQTVSVALAMVAAGAGLLSLRWLVGTLYLAWGLWAGAAVLIGPGPQWPEYMLGMVGATVLALVVSHGRRRLVDQIVASEEAADAAAVRDHLTGLANRRGLAMLGLSIIETARRHGDAAHCIFVDVDGLKRVNDLAGHAAGDEVLVAVADALRTVTRATDVVARWGGDEFCVLGPGAGMSPLELERRVRDHVRQHAPTPDEVWSARVSAGGAMLEPWDSGTLETLLGKADQEMYLRRSLRREGSPPAHRPASAE